MERSFRKNQCFFILVAVISVSVIGIFLLTRITRSVRGGGKSDFQLNEYDNDLMDFVKLVSRMRNAQTDPNDSRDILKYARHGYKRECLSILKNSKSSGTLISQIAQDWLLYMNVFKGMGRTGFYVDAGANQPKKISNTWFFDRCLGWSGVCIEGDPSIARLLRKERSCRVVSKCVSDKKGKLNFVPFGTDGVGGHVAGDTDQKSDGIEVECDTLESILDSVGVKKVDFMSLDIEANEYKAMKNFPMRKYDIDLFVVESVHTELELDRVVHTQGYWKITDLSIDDLYIKAFPLKLTSVINLERGPLGIEYRRSVERENKRCARTMTKWE